jgi:hypothetical protein
MKFRWLIQSKDVAKVKALMTETAKRSFVLNRIERNVPARRLTITREKFWFSMLGCLMTTQQRSGPDSPVSQFINTKPFPLKLKVCGTRNTYKKVERTLTKFGGIRRAPTIAQQATNNLTWLDSGGWEEVRSEILILRGSRSRRPHSEDWIKERQAAKFIAKKLKGFGPKQSRNLWQWLGLARYEIPLDSRVVRWLNAEVFPWTLSAQALADHNYYEFVMDSVRALCSRAGVLPCVFDAAVFSLNERD